MPTDRVRVLLNGDAGTLRGQDAGAVAEAVRAALAPRWTDLDVTLSTRGSIGADLSRIVADRPDVLVVGGGDGTVNGAVAKVVETETALAVLPLGTMNLVARDLSLPLDLDGALAALREAEPRRITVGLANHHVFVSHVSFGIHPWMVRHRDRRHGRSKLAKKLATLRSSVSAWWTNPRERLTVSTADDVLRLDTTLLVVANTPFAEGSAIPPKRDDLAGKELAVYVAKTSSRADTLKLAGEVMAGRWNDNAQLDVALTPVARVIGTRSRLICSIDGEVYRFAGSVDCRVMPESLTVLVPSQ